MVEASGGGPRERVDAGDCYSPRDRLYMRLAIALAAKGLGRTSPNPAVGAVVASGGRILAMGRHRRAGGAHAERAALEPLKGADLREATLYVNLEPCCHYGATPPCTELILERGVGRVVAAIPDPNPVVSDKGFDALRRGGVKVEVGLMAAQARRLNEAYLTVMALGRPLVAVKMAVTIDGRIADKTGASKWITGLKARRYVHHLRSRYDAVLVGARTVSLDDPRLTVRLVRGRDPVRMVVDPYLESVRRGLRLLQSDGGRVIYLCAADRPGEKADHAASRGIDLWEVPVADGRLDLDPALKRAAREGLSSVLVEGGAETVTSLMRAGMVDRLYLFTAPKLMGGGLSWLGDTWLGGLDNGPSIDGMSFKRVGEDMLLSAYLNWKR